jgi:vitamin-K-epoxide reductase (warfarin-sensitive)
VSTAVNAATRKLFLIIALLALAGIAVSSVSLYHHFQTSKTSYCDFGESFNCHIVNRSEYSSILGVPVAAIGIAGYLIIFLLATVYRDRQETAVALLIGAFGGLVFALYLTYIEGFVLHAWCVLCLSSLAVILVTSILAGTLFVRFRAERQSPSA